MKPLIYGYMRVEGDAQATSAPTMPLPRVIHPQRRVRATSSLTLAAVPTAAACSRMFARIVLKDWGLRALIDSAELCMSELVTNAVKTTGVLDESPKWSALTDLALIQARLVLLEDGVIIEVVDRDKQSPIMPQQRPDSEDGRGLFLVEAMSKRWNFYFPSTGGKVVWCELAFPPPLVNGLPKRVRSETAGTTSPPATPVDTELLRRVRDGLRRL
jgi:hypothetical protein